MDPRDQAPRATTAQRREFRARFAHRQMPWALGAGFAVMVLLGLIFRMEPAHPSPWAGTAFFFAAVVMGIYATIVPFLGPMALKWSYAIVMVLIMYPFLLRVAATGSEELLGVACVLAVVLVSFTLSWWPVLGGWLALTILDLTVTPLFQGPESPDNMTAVVAGAMLFSAGLLAVRVRTINQLADASIAMEKAAVTDELTGLLNRHGLELGVPVLAGTAQRIGKEIFVLYIDIDGLKPVNDLHGHDQGDQVLASVGSAMASASRQGDLVARVGGDEFLLIGIGGPGEPDTLTRRITEAVSRNNPVPDLWPGVVCVGASIAPAQGLDVDDLIRAADHNMYAGRKDRRHPH